MTDLEKTLERLEGQLESCDAMYWHTDNAINDAWKNQIYAQLVTARCAVRREMREEARAILIADWDEDTTDWNSNPGEIICPEHGRQEAITVRPGKWDCKVCNTPPPAEPWKKCPECCGILDNAGRCHDTDCPFDVLPAAKECEHEFWWGRKCMKCQEFRPIEHPELDPRPPEDK